MKNVSILFLLLFFVLSTSNDLWGQEEVQQIQPRIMVMPYAKKDQDVRTVLEDDINFRVAISKVKEGFDNRGFTTIDFVGRLKAGEVDDIFTSDSPSDVKTALIEASGADIYVEVEAHTESSASGNSARIILQAFDAFTGQSLSNKTGISHFMRHDQYDILVEQALNRKDGDTKISMVEDFLNSMQSKFDDIVENGRTVKVIFKLDGNAWFDFDYETTTGDYLSDAVYDWIHENAYKNNYVQTGASQLSVTFDQVRIPLRDKRGRNFTPYRFARDIRSGLRGITLEEDPDSEISVSRDVRGGTIYITLQ